MHTHCQNARKALCALDKMLSQPSYEIDHDHTSKTMQKQSCCLSQFLFNYYSETFNAHLWCESSCTSCFIKYIIIKSVTPSYHMWKITATNHSTQLLKPAVNFSSSNRTACLIVANWKRSTVTLLLVALREHPPTNWETNDATKMRACKMLDNYIETHNMQISCNRWIARKTINF